MRIYVGRGLRNGGGKPLRSPHPLDPPLPGGEEDIREVPPEGGSGLKDQGNAVGADALRRFHGGPRIVAETVHRPVEACAHRGKSGTEIRFRRAPFANPPAATLGEGNEWG